MYRMRQRAARQRDEGGRNMMVGNSMRKRVSGWEWRSTSPWSSCSPACAVCAEERRQGEWAESVLRRA